MAKILSLFSSTKIKQYLVSIAVSVAVGALKIFFPELPLPSEDKLVEIGMLLIGGHTLTDIAAIVKGLQKGK